MIGCMYSKTGIKLPLLKRQKLVFTTNYRLVQVKSIAECSKGSILQYFRPSLSYHYVIKIFVLSIFEWPFYTGFTVDDSIQEKNHVITTTPVRSQGIKSSTKNRHHSSLIRVHTGKFV